jgi:cytochrome b subunit of formate dehydrogenase
MSKAVPELPLTSIEEIRKFTKTAPTSAQCLECHAEPSLKDHPSTALQALLVDPSQTKASIHDDLTCVNCHIDIHEDTEATCQDSSVFKAYLASDQVATDAACRDLKKVKCRTCHQQEAELLQQSAHSVEVAASREGLPDCKNCHGTHEIENTKLNGTRVAIVDNCGTCHQPQIETYFGSYHGKTTKLGSDLTAKCSDCHGSHALLTPADPASRLHPDHIQETCSQCHADVNANFVGFIPHGDYSNRKLYPQLFYAFWAMTGLLIGTFALFGIHTVLWFSRSLLESFKSPPVKEKHIIVEPSKEKHVRRFQVSHTVLHLMIIISFLTLALTGMTLKFPDNPFFAAVVHFLGGPHNVGMLHRTGAVITFIYAALHLLQLAILFRKRKITVKGLLKEEYSLIPLLRDLRELKANLSYFIGRSPKPEYGRWTYWEKFDYMAVFWGITIIGSTGMMLWFPQKVTLLLPGWMLNVATIVHSDEALLAAGFIFTFHFFHSHLRPENFPLDPVIFTQRLPLSRFKAERSREYQALLDRGELENHLVDPPSKWYARVVLVFGIAFFVIGLVIVGAIAFSLLAAI